MLLNVFLCSILYCYYKVILFKNWGDYADLSQAVVLYVIYACNVLLICWFGTQLTQHVSMNGLLLLFFLQRHVDNAKSFQRSRNSELVTLISVLLSLKIY